MTPDLPPKAVEDAARASGAIQRLFMTLEDGEFYEHYDESCALLGAARREYAALTDPSPSPQSRRGVSRCKIHPEQRCEAADTCPCVDEEQWRSDYLTTGERDRDLAVLAKEDEPMYLEKCPRCGGKCEPDGTGEASVWRRCGDEWPVEDVVMNGGPNHD